MAFNDYCATYIILFWQKGTKNALETGRTFATLLADMNLRRRLLEARNEDEFRRILLKHSQDLSEEQSAANARAETASPMHLVTDGDNNVRLEKTISYF